MNNHIKIGQTIAGKYELIKALKETHLYQWIEAVNLKTQKAHTIQVLSNECPKGQIKEVFDYFDALKNIRREGIIPPEQFISINDLPLIIYPEFFGITLDLSKNVDLDLTLTYLSEASELLHIVNNKKLIHGQVNPKSLILKDNKVYLSGFGYAPFLMQGNQDAIEDCGDFLPPEITDANSAEKSRDTIDTYAFAKTVAYWFPNICSSAWYLQATNPDPNQRFKRMRNLFQELKKALADIFSDTAAEASVPSNPIEIPETEIKLEPESSGGIKPKYILEIELDPPEAGRVEGDGKYIEGRQVNVKAIVFPDWEFIGWDGDIVQSNTSFDLVIEKNIKIIARYKKIPKSFGSIQIEIYPSEAKEFVTFTGAGCHSLGTNVSIHARSISEKWRFSRWTGDINVAKTPFTIALTSDIKVVAEFTIVPDLKKPSSSPTKLGGAFGKHEDATSVSITGSSQAEHLGDGKFPNGDNDLKNPVKLGSAFNTTNIEETLSSSETSTEKPSKKPIIGSAFNDSE